VTSQAVKNETRRIGLRLVGFMMNVTFCYICFCVEGALAIKLSPAGLMLGDRRPVHVT
jgi:hypothetical protein